MSKAHTFGDYTVLLEPIEEMKLVFYEITENGEPIVNGHYDGKNLSRGMAWKVLTSETWYRELKGKIIKDKKESDKHNAGE